MDYSKNQFHFRIFTAVQRVRSQSGSILMNALIIIGIVSIVALIILKSIQEQSKLTQYPRRKSVVTSTEGEVRNLVLQPSVYSGCVVNPAGGFTGCVFDASELTKLQKEVRGANCPPSVPLCGVTIQPKPAQPLFDPATGRFQAQIIYTGSDVSIKPIDIDVKVPTEVLAGTATCPPATPLFKGFNAAGGAICGGLNASGKTSCAIDEYIAGVDAITMELNCRKVPTAIADCSAGNQMLAGFSWTGDNVSAVCEDRQNPDTYFGFSPIVSSGPGVYAPPLPPPADDPPKDEWKVIGSLVNGKCGPANANTLPTGPTLPADLCDAGTPGPVAGTGPWSWQCLGSMGGFDVSCAANKTVVKVDGKCGPADGATMAAAPSLLADLCEYGSATVVSGTGPWNWQCLGSGGGIDVSCSAKSSAAPPCDDNDAHPTMASCETKYGAGKCVDFIRWQWIFSKGNKKFGCKVDSKVSSGHYVIGATCNSSTIGKTISVPFDGGCDVPPGEYMDASYKCQRDFRCAIPPDPPPIKGTGYVWHHTGFDAVICPADPKLKRASEGSKCDPAVDGMRYGSSPASPSCGPGVWEMECCKKGSPKFICNP